LPAFGENILSNSLLQIGIRTFGGSWAQTTPDSILENLTSPWVWDTDEFFVNQFGHPYQGSTYHSAARSNGFNFYEATLFDAFGSITWELFCEVNTPSINDFICTTLGGASLGEMLHRLYLETPSPLAVAVSPVDAFNGLITKRRPLRQTKNIYSMSVATGLGYTYAAQSVEKIKDGDLIKMNMQNITSADVSSCIVYGDPFSQQSMIPYKHFELLTYASIGIPLWYNIKILSDGYLFSFNAIDKESSKASTGLTLNYDLFSDKHIDFFNESLNWTFKYQHQFNNNVFLELKSHLGWTIFSSDTFYVQDKDAAGLRKTENDYGTGFNSKLFFSIYRPQKWKFKLDTLIYKTVDFFQSWHQDDVLSFCLLCDVDYVFFINNSFGIGIGDSLLRNFNSYAHIENAQKWTNILRIYAEWSIIN
jgi:hypothetical protein